MTVKPAVLGALVFFSSAHADRVHVTVDNGTPHDEARLADIARELEGSRPWAAKLTKTFRLRIHARGGVRGLTELDSKNDAHASDDVIVACKLIRNRIWRAPLKGSGTARTVTAKFTFAPR